MKRAHIDRIRFLVIGGQNHHREAVRVAAEVDHFPGSVNGGGWPDRDFTARWTIRDAPPSGEHLVGGRGAHFAASDSLFEQGVDTINRERSPKPDIELRFVATGEDLLPVRIAHG